MQDNSIYILSTRPVDPSLILEAAESNIIIESASFIHTNPVNDETLTKRIDNLVNQQLTVVFTSVTAAEIVKTYLDGMRPDWRIYCMGYATKDFLLNYFDKDQVSGTAGNAAELADLIIKHKERRTVFFCGDQRRDELPDKLAAGYVQVEEIIVYQTIETPQKIARNYHGILFFSPSAVESFFTLNKVPPETVLFAIGSTTEKTLQVFSPNKIVIGDLPGKNHLVEKAINYFTTSNHTNEQIKK